MHVYLYCLNDPINNADPSGEVLGFIGSAWLRGKEAVVKVGGPYAMMQKIRLGATIFNATTSGIMNIILGPESASDSAKFAIGFAAGTLEMQLGFRSGPSVGSAAAGLLTSTLNEWASENPWSVSSAARIGAATLIGAGLGGLAEWVDPKNFTRTLELWLLFRNRELWTRFLNNIEEIYK